ncbi:MAG: hypothetical protein Q8P64_19460, partial [Deltaproteobacteria bacterium]|nr:hypothetical protein [Deltaproteobacteria bacterium]
YIISIETVSNTIGSVYVMCPKLCQGIKIFSVSEFLSFYKKQGKRNCKEEAGRQGPRMAPPTTFKYVYF